jgi:hypothetical protein
MFRLEFHTFIFWNARLFFVDQESTSVTYSAAS